MNMRFGRIVCGIIIGHSLRRQRVLPLGHEEKRDQDRHQKQTSRGKECRNPSKLKGYHPTDSWAKRESCEFGTFNQTVRFPDIILGGHVTGVGECACCVRSMTYPEHRQSGADAYRELQEPS